MAKNSRNAKGTGAGKPEPLTDAEDIILKALQNRGSDVVEGVEGGQELGLGNQEQREVHFDKISLVLAGMILLLNNFFFLFRMTVLKLLYINNQMGHTLTLIEMLLI